MNDIDEAGAAGHPLIRRRDAAQATLDSWRKRRWRMGEADCVRMTAAHLRMLGYRVKLPPKGSYRTIKAARAKLEEAGFATLADALDALKLERIAPAAALVGDIIELASDDGEGGLLASMGTLVVALGNGRVVGWHPDAPHGAEVLQPTEFVAAWRVEPKCKS